jgi:methyltransferase-like protein
VCVYRDDRSRAINTKDPSVRRALARLAEHYPATLSWQQLVDDGPPTDDRTRVEARVSGLLLKMVVAGQATASVLPLQVGRAAADRPKVSALARIEAAAGQTWVTNLQHAPVALPPVAAVLLASLDGSNDRQTLRTILARALTIGKVRVPELQSNPEKAGEGAELVALSGHYVESTVAYLARYALLEA